MIRDGVQFLQKEMVQVSRQVNGFFTSINNRNHFIMKQNIIVVDDFYENPQEVRECGLKEEYLTPEGEYTYPGKNSTGVYYSKEIHRSFEELVKEPLIPAGQEWILSYLIRKRFSQTRYSCRSIVGVGCNLHAQQKIVLMKVVHPSGDTIPSSLRTFQRLMRKPVLWIPNI